MKKLLFLDTNIYLNFYRVRNESGLSLLRKLEEISDRVIVTSQVEMEFKKNRHAALTETMQELTNITKNLKNVKPEPGLLAENQSMTALQQNVKLVRKNIQELQSQLQQVLTNPAQSDPVYKTAEKVLTKHDELSLKRGNEQHSRIARRAMRRFFMGYPPRKKSDTAIGDALNWEWIIEVAGKKNADIVLVSNDSDYGCRVNAESYMNDWLIEEFKERTSPQREVVLYSKLSDALSELSVRVTKQELSEEEAMLSRGYGRISAGASSNALFALEDLMQELYNSLQNRGPGSFGREIWHEDGSVTSFNVTKYTYQ